MSGELSNDVPEFICVKVDDPVNLGRKCEAIIRTSSIVKIIARQFEDYGRDGTSKLTPYDPEAPPISSQFSRIVQHFVFIDSFGSQYFTFECCPKTQVVIRQLWDACFSKTS